MTRKREFLVDLLHLFVLAGFALAQPLLDLLGRYAEFFVARQSRPLDIWLLVVFLSILVPCGLCLVEVAARALGEAFRKRIHAGLVALLVVVAVLPAVKRIPAMPGAGIIAVALGVGIGFTVCYLRFQPVRTFLTVLFPSVLLFPALFLFHSPVSKLVFSHEEPQAVHVEIRNPVPVVMIVFDEFCVTSLMNKERKIDAVRFPHFAAFVKDAIWFRKATTVTEITSIALPALLTGRYPDRYRLPNWMDHPNNLFTLLSGSYRLKVFEPVTDLCPNKKDDAWHPLAFKDRMRSLAADLSVVYLHILLPKEYEKVLPDVAHNWKGFMRKGQTSFREQVHKAFQKNRPRLFQAFLDSMDDSERPTLYFLHILLPHAPYDYLPSGKLYARGRTLYGLHPNSEWWCKEKAPVVHAFQRYLLQVGFVDRLLGNLVRRLKEKHLYRRALVVLVSDHGVSFIPGDYRRPFTERNYPDIMSMVCMIKRPGLGKGGISDRNVESIDVLPTIADVLGISLPWKVDGQSVFSTGPGRTRKVVFTKDYRRYELKPEQVSKEATLQRQERWFETAGERGGFVYVRSPHHLIGKRVADLRGEGSSPIGVILEQEDAFARYDPKSSFAPCHIVARLDLPRGIREPDLAVVVNGIVRAEAQPVPYRPGEVNLSVIVPESAFRPGANRVEVFEVRSRGMHVVLLPTRQGNRARVAYRLSGDGNTLWGPDGAAIPLRHRSVGFVDGAVMEKGVLRLGGWAADPGTAGLPERIVLFSGTKFVYQGGCNVRRPDVAEHFKNPLLLKCGFYYLLPGLDRKGAGLRVFAVFKGWASELTYTPGARWICKTPPSGATP